MLRWQAIAELAINLLLARIKIRIAPPQRRVLSAQLIVQRLRLTRLLCFEFAALVARFTFLAMLGTMAFSFVAHLLLAPSR